MGKRPIRRTCQLIKYSDSFVGVIFILKPIVVIMSECYNSFMMSSPETIGKNFENGESTERIARRKLGQAAFNSVTSLSEGLVQNHDSEDGSPDEINFDDISAMRNRIRQLDPEDQDSLRESLDCQKKQRKEAFDYYFEEYYYPKQWLETREILLSTVAAPGQNSNDIDKHTKSLANALTSAILNLDIPEDRLKRVSGILTSKHLPDFAKQMSIFQLIWPFDELDLEFDVDQRLSGQKRTAASGEKYWGKVGSPVLATLIRQQKQSRDSGDTPPKEGIVVAEDGRRYTTEEVIYCDILKCAFGSNGKSIKSFLNDLENGDAFIKKLHEADKTQKVSNCFSNDEITDGVNLIETLNSLYYSQMQSGKREDQFQDVGLPNFDKIMDGSVGELEQIINKAERIFGASSRYTIGDRVVRSFCYPIGITGISSAYDYLEEHQSEATTKNIKNAEQDDITHFVGDYIYKGISNVEYLSSILEDGILSKEYLGVGVARDLTPLDTDFSTANDMIEGVIEEIREYHDSSYTPKTNMDLADALEESIAYRFSDFENKNGLIVAIKRDQRFQDEHGENKKPLYNRDKYGIFRTDSWDLVSATSKTLGVRTGVPSTEIDYIIVYEEDADKAIEYVMRNNFYVPVIDFDGNVLLPPEEWLANRSK